MNRYQSQVTCVYIYIHIFIFIFIFIYIYIYIYIYIHTYRMTNEVLISVLSSNSDVEWGASGLPW